MGHPAEKSPPNIEALYEQDLCAWAETNAFLLRGGQLSQIDIAHIAEELEDMGKSERRSLRSHIRNLIAHLLKWQYQPERRGTSWELTILNARNEIEDILKDSPSLAQNVQEYVESVYPAAKKTAAIETNLNASAFPAACPYTTAQLRDDEYRPGV